MRTLIPLIAALTVAFAAPPPHSPPTSKPLTVACDDQGDAASVAALRLINAHHHHGYKYRLSKTRSRIVEQKDDSSCEIKLQLDLEETKCHIVNPKPAEKCELRDTDEIKVKADCNVTLTVKEGKPEIKFSCTSGPGSSADLWAECPDCPTLIPLNDTQGLDSVKQAIEKFHQESKVTSFFKLMEVGRISTQHTFMGQTFLGEFAIVETTCARGSVPENREICRPLCDSVARHGFCSSTMLGSGEVYADCELYDAQNVTDEGHHHHPDGPPACPGHHEHHARLPPHRPPPGPPYGIPVDPHHMIPHGPAHHCPGQRKTEPFHHPICPPPPFSFAHPDSRPVMPPFIKA